MPADRLEQIYPPTYYSFASGGSAMGLAGAVKRRIDARSFRRVLRLLDHPRPNILDVGGGTGEIAAGFVRQAGPGSRGTVVDIDAESLVAAHSRGLGGWQGRFEEFETTERFDLILMLNLIEHVADPVAVLAKARSLLSERGLIWMQTPNFRALDARIFRHLNWSGYHCPRHFVLFSEAGLPGVLADAGLEQVELRRTQGAPFWAGSVCGLRRRHDPAVAGGLPKPLVLYRSFAPLAAAGAAFDFATRRFRQVSQVMVVARAA
jgi:SAM-dependent methyltransferase